MRIKRYMVANVTRSWVYYTDQQWLARLIRWCYRRDHVRIIDNQEIL